MSAPPQIQITDLCTDNWNKLICLIMLIITKLYRYCYQGKTLVLIKSFRNCLWVEMLAVEHNKAFRKT